MRTYIDDMYMTVFDKDGILTLRWKKTTSNFTDEDFKEEARKFIKTVEESQCKKIVVDMRHFQYSLSDEIIEWRKDHIIEKYNTLHVEKFAFISKKSAVKQDDPSNTFVTETFGSESEAVAWISRSEN